MISPKEGYGGQSDTEIQQEGSQQTRAQALKQERGCSSLSPATYPLCNFE